MFDLSNPLGAADARTPMQAHCQSLEPRRLLSATLDDGLLLVRGTEEADVITLRPYKDVMVVRVNSDRFRFDPDDVERIEFQGEGGDDLIAFKRLRTGALGVGGAGDDTIRGGFGDDSIGGGNGHDSLVGLAGDDLMSGCAGDDVVRGVWGDDTLHGNQGEDALIGFAGDDRLIADELDTISGGAGDNEIVGGAPASAPDGDDLEGGAKDDVLGKTDPVPPEQIGRPRRRA